LQEYKIKNPIIPGYYPDPSICRVGDDYYLICSSFELSPGIPIFHSKDLANWEKIGNVMSKENGFEMSADFFAGGVMAPTIRYHDGVFYIINANFSHRGNYIVTATDPAGPWSEPRFLDEDVPGLDASIFFDDDGKCYVMGTGKVEAPYGPTRGIWVQEFDVKTMHTVGEPHGIWDCALKRASSPEAPHLYRRGDWYYLIIAEGGTEHYHCVSVARSKNLFEWFEANPANPIMTHRQLGYTYPWANMGHTDIVELPDGSWYAVMLGSRNIEGPYKNMGRETFACPVTWELDWPVFSVGTGKIEESYPMPECLTWTPFEKQPAKDDFEGDKLGYDWVFWGTPYQDFWRVEDSKLKLHCLPREMDRQMHAIGKMPTEPKQPPRDDCISVVLRRQTDIDFDATMKMSFVPENAETAGFVIMQASNNHFRVELKQEDGKQYLLCQQVVTTKWMHVIYREYDADTTRTELARVPFEGKDVVVYLKARGQTYDFYYGTDENDLQPLYLGVDAKLLNQPVTGNMVGTCMGMFASANGAKSDNWAEFDYFTYEGKD